MTQATLSLAAGHHQAGRLREAEQLYRQVLQSEPNSAQALELMGMLLFQMGRIQEAVPLLERAASIDGSNAHFQLNLATALLEVSRFEESAAACRRALELRPKWPEAWYNLGCLSGRRQQWEEAAACYRSAIVFNPDYAEAWYNLGDALRATGDSTGAKNCFRKSAAIKHIPEALNNLANCLLQDGELDEAIKTYRRLLADWPDFAAARSNFGKALMDFGRAAEAVEVLQPLVQIPFANDNLLMALHYLPDADPAGIFQEHRLWDERHARRLAGEIRPHANTGDPKRRLRVGYVSPDFHLHSVTFFLENLLSAHDAAEVEVFAYADLARPDAVTERLRKYVHQWRSLNGMNDQAVAELIRKDGIDILVDLAGHTSGNRLLAFARKPAPIQITYLGYPDTSGLSAMDYRLTDGYADPPGKTEQFYSEKLLRLPRAFACYRPPAEATDVTPLPALASGGVTFGGFTTLAKTPPALLDSWAEILQRTPGSRLVIAAAGLQAAELQEEIQKRFDRHGVEKDRVELLGRCSLADYFALHHRVDIYLDTFPVNGHTVTCHALWMGLPVVTLAGEVHCGRLGASVLNNLGLAEWIAQSPAEYVRLAVELAGDLKRLENLRAALRERMKNSPLLDAAGFAREVERGFRRVWEEWCASHAS
ncbi:MAG: tetratricopeptide repeat protein [Tepidisphaeraceae bacterium]|jgi:predicted O-linked N-acetylglucosamine transferase (SPINDLY family)